jgi:serine phosphatase RsbU (regulator of sigma subunit)
MAGPEIHVQLLESLFEDDLLRRPRWIRWAEAAFTAVIGVALVLAVPLLSARTSLIAMLGILVLTPALGFAVYRHAGLLVDAAVPVACLVLVFTGVLGATLAETQRQRRALREQLAREHEAAVRLAGELEAARRVQMDMLPDPVATFPGETRFALHAYLAPAREVGGDLYDFFPLDDHRLFFVIGDVSGSGMDASVFMAISRALCKSTALRRHDAVAAIVRETNAEVSRDNPEAFFVTACAGVLDADTGILTYVNAGHETPLAVASDGSVRALEEGGGPPLCVDEDFAYVSATYRMRPGEAVCLVTDGVTEAVSAGGAFYGRARLRDALGAVGAGANAAKIGEAVRGDVERFAAGHEQSDDMAILVVQWAGTNGR